MLYIKAHFPKQQYEDAFEELWVAYWRDHLDLSKPEFMRECLKRHFTAEEAKTTIEAGTSQEYKKMLTEKTGELVARGAYGCPWFFVTNGDGKVEPFFGSDRSVASLEDLALRCCC